MNKANRVRKQSKHKRKANKRAQAQKAAVNTPAIVRPSGGMVMHGGALIAQRASADTLAMRVRTTPRLRTRYGASHEKPVNLPTVHVELPRTVAK